MLKVRVAVATERTETKATIEERMMDRMMIRKGLPGKFVKVQSGLSMSVYERTAGQRVHEYILTAHAQHSTSIFITFSSSSTLEIIARATGSSGTICDEGGEIHQIARTGR
jgi:hypothetical protein